MAELILKDEVYAMIGAAMEVHSELGNGFLEAVYQEALEIECGCRGIPFMSQAPLQVRYKGRPLRKHYIADLVCYDQVIVELKVAERLISKDEAQLLHYLHATQKRVGLLINFGSTGQLEWKRLVV